MKSRRFRFQLVPSTPRIDGIDSSLWLGTPGGEAMAQDAVRSAEFRTGRTPSPQEAVKMLHTPTGTANQLSPSMVGRDAGSWGLWPTPAASEARQGYPNRQGDKEGTQESLSTVVIDGQGGRDAISGQLNPTWVEWLMGFPLGWTDLEPSEMP